MTSVSSRVRPQFEDDEAWESRSPFCDEYNDEQDDFNVLSFHHERLANLTHDPDERWLSYLRALPQRDLTADAVNDAMELLWQDLRRSVPNIHPPDASPTDDRTLLMSWDRDQHHLEIEVMPSGKYLWFYRDHDVNSDEIGEGAPAEPLSEDLLAHARKIFS